MTRHDDEIRRILREGDPAREGELAPVDRARMRAAITSAAAQRVPRRSVAPLLAIGAAMATVVAALLLLVPQAERHRVTPPAPQAEVAPEPVVSPPPLEPIVVKRAVRARPARPRPRPALVEERVSTTRIMFTGPEGTRILWFVGTSDAKELGS